MISATTGKKAQSSAMQASVLALNKTYSPVHVISAKRAFCLLSKDIAEVISVEDGSFMNYDFSSWIEISELRSEFNERNELEDWVLSVNFEIQVPRVVRLLRYDRIPNNTIKFNRRNIFIRDSYRCQYCQRKYSVKQLSLDHVVPRSQGGGMNWENIVSACHRCNTKKGGRTPSQAGMKLLQKPAKPSRNPVLQQQVNHAKYACWKNFIGSKELLSCD
ncbi:MAG: HNH endonuclease [Planctomycetota bacterium]